MYSYFKWPLKWTHSLHNARLRWLGCFLWHTSNLRPCKLIILTTADIQGCRTCLANYMGFISCHITPLVITSFRADTQTHIHLSWINILISRNQACAGLWPVRTNYSMYIQTLTWYFNTCVSKQRMHIQMNLVFTSALKQRSTHGQWWWRGNFMYL